MEKIRKLFFDYLKHQGVGKIYDYQVYTNNPDLVKDIIHTFGYNVLVDYHLNTVVYKVDSKVYKATFDSEGIMYEYVGYDGTRWEKEYDKNNNCIYYKSRREEWEKKFDSENNCIYYKDDEVEWEGRYDKNNKLISKTILSDNTT